LVIGRLNIHVDNCLFTVIEETYIWRVYRDVGSCTSSTSTWDGPSSATLSLHESVVVSGPCSCTQQPVPRKHETLLH